MTINDSGHQNGYTIPTPQTADETPKTKPVYQQEPVAVVGMACRLPGQSNSPTALWELLMRGGIADNNVPKSRFDLSTHYDGSKKPKTMRSPGGMFLENIDPKNFDAGFFATSHADAMAMDPQQRQLLEVVYECLENAGASLESMDGAAVACLVGSYAVDYEAMQARDPEDRVPSVTIGVGRAILSNRISHFLNIKGPSMTIDTACSGSLVSLDVACRYLTTGEVDGAIVAGANLYLSPEHNLDSGAMKGASSVSGKCHTFDVKADGYIKAEGINAVYLKRVSDAIRDNDPILAVIRGSSTNSDGRTPGIASPSAEAQTTAIRAAYGNAGLSNFNDTSYLEFHGTGTQAGDPTEVRGVASVFSPSRDPQKPLYIGSVKSNIGHSEPAAGISGLMKAVLCIENGMIPGNPTFLDPNPKIDFAGSRVSVSRVARRWPDAPFKRASVNSFGYGGSNAHVVLEEAASFTHTKNHVSSYVTDTGDFFEDEEASSSRPHTLVLSANDDESLQANFAALRAHLINPKVKVDLADLAYTLSERRTKLFSRGYIVFSSTNLDAAAFVRGKKNTDTPNIGFVFTGQGAQWPQMGQALVDTFPSAKKVLNRLDAVLQDLPDPPSWSLLDELTQPRGAEALRRPEFSQPLVTALQLVIVDVLKGWGVSPQSVVGHSSGEIAAAYTAGLISEEDAIIAAFYRGYASTRAPKEQDLGMLATGISASEFPVYAQGLEDLVSIACFNSPQSITISGPVTALEQLRTRLVDDQKFGRLLQVDLAYHSKFMASIGAEYHALLSQNFSGQDVEKNVRMFSSVTGKLLDGSVDVDYWKSNMVSPVLFDQAVREMLSSDNNPDFLIEIGPSGALAGPIKQIKTDLGDEAANIQYCAALARGRDAIKSIYETAGKLFVAGGSVDLSAVNQLQRAGEKNPAVIVDLPNYSWNYSTTYWYENDASKDWRYRMFPHHDLLGSKILNTSWNEPSFKKILQLENLPWLKDHKMGTDIIFPAAGFLVMAIEAMRQKTHASTVLDGKPEIKSPSYRLRNLTFSRALVLEERKEHKVMLTLAPKTGSGNTWHSYKVSSMVGGSWQENSRGLIKVEEQVERVAPEGALEPLQHPTDGRLWYKAMNDAGYGFGPAFQKQLQVESFSRKRSSRSIVSLEEPKSADTQSPYPMHPAVMDGCFQTSAPSLWSGNRSDVDTVLIPAIIDEVIINQQSTQIDRAIALSTSKYVGVGRQDVPKNYLSNSSVYNPETGSLVFQLSGLRYHKLDTNEEVYSKHAYSQVVWKPDITTLSGASDHFDLLANTEDGAIADANQLLDLAAHKKPHLSVLEINQLTGDPSSIWLDGNGSQSDVSVRTAYRRYRYATPEPADLMAAQEAYSARINTEFDLFDIDTPIEAVEDDQKFDLVILKAQGSPDANAVAYARAFLTEGASLVLLEHGGNKFNGASATKECFSNGETNGTCKINGVNGSNGPLMTDIWKDMKFITSKTSTDSTGATISVSIGTSRATEVAEESKTRHLNLLHFAKPSIPEMKMREKLIASGWDITEHSCPFVNLDPNSISVVLEFGAPIMNTITEEKWEELKNLLSSGNKLLWVTEGSQMDVTNPTKAMIHGLARTVRAEDSSVNITTLDVQDATRHKTLDAIINVLGKLQEPKDKKYTENEFVERHGVINVPRVLPDNALNRTEATEVNTSLHEAKTTIRLQCERIGTLDDLHYQEVASTELPLEENKVEVEVYSAGLNFKDIAVTMVIVPENEYLLGLEGAGIVRRVHPSVTKFKPGERVLVFEKGTFANRIILTTERTHHIPDSMSFEEASTLASVYLTALYSTYNLANTQKGHRVLIHSATGGLGQATIQICQHIGAEVYSTVGNEEKKKYLVDNFGIPEDHIFGSRTTDFASKLMNATDGAGVDVIINTLTEDLLDESWRCIATGGTMVELGKKDMIDRNFLSMEPFGRNASYRAFDLSHKSVTDQVIGRLLGQLMGFISEGHLKPIGPIKTFSFTEISSAFRYMRGANHIGKIVITDGPDAQIKVPARLAPRMLALRDDVSYLIVGGLKGLCGTMAVQMARHGAKHLIILSRSGCGDEKSQAALQQINANGCSVIDCQGDVANEEDVRRCFAESPLPVGGVIQGAMVLRDRAFMSMTINDYHQAIEAKVKGTWNLHNVSLEKDSRLDFFTMLSSVSGVVGQRGQANYAAANVFLDNFANYRRKLGLRACSVDLGAIQDVGYLSEHTDILQAFDPSWTPINEGLFTKIFRNALLQDIAPLHDISSRGAQLITGIAIPQPDGSRLLADARFAGLDFGTAAGGDATKGGDNVSKDVQALLLLLKSGAKQTAIMKAALEAVNRQFVLTLRLSEPMEPGKPLTSYGMDSLTAVEFRNWARLELKAELTALEIANASSLHALCEKIVSKMARV